MEMCVRWLVKTYTESCRRSDLLIPKVVGEVVDKEHDELQNEELG